MDADTPLSPEMFLFLQQEEDAAGLYTFPGLEPIRVPDRFVKLFDPFGHRIAKLHLTDLVVASDLPGWLQLLSDSKGSSTRGIFRYRRGKDVEFYAETRLRLVQWEKGSALLVMLRDVTAMQQVMSAAMARESSDRWGLDKKSNLGKASNLEQIAGGVSHHFNNLLTIIELHAGLLLARKDLSSNEKDSLGAISTAVARGNEITRQLRAYAAQSRIYLQQHDLGQLLDRLKPELEEMLPSRLKVQHSVTPNLSRVMVDPRLLEQILKALLQNAIDFTEGEGVIRIQGSQPPGQNNEVLLTVADFGRGIPPEVMPHISEPFFTTKPPGEAAGLGLAAVQGSIRQMGGRFEVESGPGFGTIVKIFLRTPP